MNAYLGLFVAAFIAATLIPAQSEAVLVTMLWNSYSPWLVITVATLGNVLGSLLNWSLGREALRFSNRRWFPVSENGLAKAQAWYQRYGKWSLLMSWMPIIGDPLTVAAGLMRERLLVFLPLVLIAKFGRYCVLMVLTLQYL